MPLVMVAMLFLITCGIALRGKTADYGIHYALLLILVLLFTLVWQSVHDWQGVFTPAYAVALGSWALAMVVGIVVGTFGKWLIEGDKD